MRTRGVRADESGRVDVYLRPRFEIGDSREYGRTRPFLSRAEFAARHGARDDDIAQVVAFAAAYELKVLHSDPIARRIRLGGTWSALGEAFGTPIDVMETDGEPIYRNAQDLSLPAALAPAITGVLGFDTTPALRPHGTFSSGSNAITVAQALQRYQVPALTPGGDACDGTGETIALLQFGASFSLIGFQSHFTSLGVPVPRCHVRNDLLSRDPGTAENVEAICDAVLVGTFAPGALIVVWLCDDFTTASLGAAVGAAANDAREPASIISVSYGWIGWADADRKTADDVCAGSAALGVTCISSSADSGGVDPGGVVQSPGEFPHVLSVGGTVLKADGTEVVWNNAPLASTGGYSNYFAAPSWQVATGFSGTKRGVPDVSAHADIWDLGAGFFFNGTSSSAPFWATLVARLNQMRRDAGGDRLGLIAPDLYTNSDAFTDITLGDNGIGTNTGYAATTGWDPATGLGSPIGAKLAQRLVPLSTLRVMEARVSPSPVALSPATATFTITATDQATGVAVQGARVFLLDQQIGEAGSAISQIIRALDPPVVTTTYSRVGGSRVAVTTRQTYPSVVIRADGYQPVTIPLGPPQLVRVT